MEITHNDDDYFREALTRKFDLLRSGIAKVVLSDGSTVAIHDPVHVGADYIECYPGPDAKGREQIIPLRSIVSVII